MKILFVITSLNRGGAENFLLSKLQTKAFESQDVMVVSVLGAGELSSAFNEAGVRVINAGISKNPFSWLRWFSICCLVRSFTQTS